MKNIKSIDIIFENCEYININSKDIIWLNFKNIEQEIHRVACNSISKITFANQIEIVLKKNIKTTDYIFSEGYDGVQRLFMCNDITSFTIIYEDNTEETIYVDWEDDIHPEYNKNQEIVNNNGYIFIGIGKNKSEIMKNLLEEFNNDSLNFYNDFID